MSYLCYFRKTETLETVKPESKENKAPNKPAEPKSKLKSAYGKYAGVIVEKADCWDADLKKTIRA